MPRLRLVLIASAVLALATPLQPLRSQPAQQPGNTYEIYGVRFAGYHGYPVRELVRGADTSRRADLAFIVWVLRPTQAVGTPSRVVLFDAGFYRDKFLAEWKPVDFVRPSEAVERVGVHADQVTDIIVSHVHWDHLDGADLFPRAKVWLQRAEYEHYVDPQGMPRSRTIDSADAAMLARLSREGRLGLIDGDAREVIPGITVYTGGRHTFASQYITAHAAHGTVVLASDNVYMYENLDRHVPIAATFTPADSGSNLRAQDRMRTFVADPRFILPGHDPQIFTRFPAAGQGVVRIQ
jgi:glyoxylase-like metal-dependent hydrolase (beta-lactamase superfamily II)